MQNTVSRDKKEKKDSNLIDTEDFIYVPRTIIGLVGIILIPLILLIDALSSLNLTYFYIVMIAEYGLVVGILARLKYDFLETLGIAFFLVAPIINVVVLVKVHRDMSETDPLGDPLDATSFRHYFLYMIGKPLYFVMIDPDDILAKNMVKVTEVVSDKAVHVTASKKIYATVLLKHSDCDGTIL